MDLSFLTNVRSGLQNKRQGLSDLLTRTPPAKKQISLGPVSEQVVQESIASIDLALQQAESGSLGICEVCHHTVEEERLMADYTCCICLDHYTPEQLRQLESDLELSTVVQRALLPQEQARIPGVETASFSRPAQIIGGDYYDYLHLQDGSHGLVIADVAGHGISASLLMSSVQTALRALAPTSSSPAEIIRHVNRLFHRNIQFTTFVTVFLACYNPATHSLTYCNAGHNPPLLLRNGSSGAKQSAWLRPTSAAIGLIEEFPAVEETIALHPDDLLLLYTDGVTEATNPANEYYGQERLMTTASRFRSLPAAELVQNLRQDLFDFISGQPLADDTTVVALKVIE
jgi:sigma-B regulation protein RsbU (phosphoserine phosphatase)